MRTGAHQPPAPTPRPLWRVAGAAAGEAGEAGETVEAGEAGEAGEAVEAGLRVVLQQQQPQVGAVEAGCPSRNQDSQAGGEGEKGKAAGVGVAQAVDEENDMLMKNS